MAAILRIDGTEYHVSDETAQALVEIANQNRISPEAALKQALLNQKFIEQQTATGAKLLIERNGSLRELVTRPTPSGP